MKLHHHILIAARLVPVVVALWWLDLREPGSAIARVREAAPARPEALRRGILHGAVAALAIAVWLIPAACRHPAAAAVCAGAGTYAAIALYLHDRMEAL